METYISILRGINVGGRNKIKMDALMSLYKNLDFVNIRSYVQSGNVIFSSKKNDVKVLENQISLQIKKAFGLDVPVFVLNVNTLKDIIKGNPFTKDNKKNSAFMHVTFLSNQPKQFDKESIYKKRSENEEIAFVSNAVYLYCPNGYGNTKLSNNFLERKLNVPATTRNWKTTTELFTLATEENT